MAHTRKLPPTAKIHESVVLEDGVQIGEHVVIGPHSVILANTIIGDYVTIGSHCILGIQPSGNSQMRKPELSETLVIGAHVRIGHFVSIYRGTNLANEVFVGDYAGIREHVEIGVGTVIGRSAIIELNTKIGSHCTIQTLAYVTGDTIVEDHVFIGPCVSMSNDKYMGKKEYTLKGPHICEGARIGNQASLLPGIRIGRDAIVGAGTVVTKDVEDSSTVVGSPARKLEKSKEE